MGLVALRHVRSSQTRARTRVPCIGRQILNHCATREALLHSLTIEKKLVLFQSQKEKKENMKKKKAEQLRTLGYLTGHQG